MAAKRNEKAIAELEDLLSYSIPEPRETAKPASRGFYAKGKAVQFTYDGGELWGKEERVLVFCCDQSSLCAGGILLSGEQTAGALAALLNNERKKIFKEIAAERQ